MTYFVTKTLNPNKGYPCTFRNWRAESHCHNWHGYDLIFSVTIEADELTKEGWVYDFGKFGPLKDRVDMFFDHTWIIAEDDPLLALTKIYVETAALNGMPCGKLVVLPNVGAEHFATWFAVETADLLMATGDLGRCRVRHAHCAENGANSGGYEYEPDSA